LTLLLLLIWLRLLLLLQLLRLLLPILLSEWLMSQLSLAVHPCVCPPLPT
jgi:hypothetical protein